jgi:hypothetical protein
MKHPISHNAVRFTAWSAIVGGLLSYVTLGLLVMVSGLDTEIVFRGDAMLTLPPETRSLFRWAMLTDVFGFYLPFLVIGGYLWHTFQEEAGALGHTAVMAVALFVTVGISGAVIQLAAIHPLALLQMDGDATAKAAAAAAWTTVANVAQRGLWWSEGPVFLFWTLVVGSQLKKAGWGRAFLLKIVGLLMGVFFVLGLFPELNLVTSGVEMIVVSLLPLWMLLFGRQLLRHPQAYAAPAAAM